MTSLYDPYGKIYTILPEEWASYIWFFEPVFIPSEFREHLVLVLGWTTGRRGYVSIAMITPNIPSEANPDHYVRIRSPRRRVNTNEIAVTLRKNKRFSALVENSYVRLDRVWEVPFAIMSEVPRTGMQLMVRAVSMEMIMEVYSTWDWDQAWGRTYQSCPGYLQWAGYCQNQNDLRPPESIKQNGEAEHPQMTRQPTQTLNGLAPSGTLEQDGNPEDEALPGSDSIGSWDSAYRPDEEEKDGCSEEGASPCTRQEMFYAGDVHCAALAKLLQEAR